MCYVVGAIQIVGVVRLIGIVGRCVLFFSFGRCTQRPYHAIGYLQF